MTVKFNAYEKKCEGIENEELKKYFPDCPKLYSKSKGSGEF